MFVILERSECSNEYVNKEYQEQWLPRTNSGITSSVR